MHLTIAAIIDKQAGEFAIENVGRYRRPTSEQFYRLPLICSTIVFQTFVARTRQLIQNHSKVPHSCYDFASSIVQVWHPIDKNKFLMVHCDCCRITECQPTALIYSRGMPTVTVPLQLIFSLIGHWLIASSF